MQGQSTKRFWSAQDVSDWRAIVREGERLLLTAKPCERIDLSLQVCMALERLGAYLETADYAAMGVQACEDAGVRDSRYAALLRGLGRGQYYRQLYNEAARTYAALHEWAVENGDHKEAVVAQYSVACCLEKASPDLWSEAIELYESVFTSDAADWPHKLAATVNHIGLLMTMGRSDVAYDVATTRFLAIPSEEKQGTPWIEFLVLMARLLIEKGDAESALLVMADAVDITPENRPVTAAKVHAVYGLAQHMVGETEEALGEIELAWAYAEAMPSVDAYQLIREIEQQIRG